RREAGRVVDLGHVGQVARLGVAVDAEHVAAPLGGAVNLVVSRRVRGRREAGGLQKVVEAIADVYADQVDDGARTALAGGGRRDHAMNRLFRLHDDVLVGGAKTLEVRDSPFKRRFGRADRFFARPRVEAVTVLNRVVE